MHSGELKPRCFTPFAVQIICREDDSLRRRMSDALRNFIEMPYAELEERNLAAKDQRKRHVPADKIREERLKYLTDEKHIKAVTVLFSDLEGRLHMLDYDKKFIVKSDDNLTFDGSSIRGFTAQRESDLRLGIDWGSFLLIATSRMPASRRRLSRLCASTSCRTSPSAITPSQSVLSRSSTSAL